MSENDTQNIEKEESKYIKGPDGEPVLVKKIYLTNRNYEKYYKKLEREASIKLNKEKEEKQKNRISRGKLTRQLLQKEIEDIQKVSKSAKECARLLGVSYPTYKKYAKMYGVFENLKNVAGRGIRKIGAGRKPSKNHSLEFLLEGGNPSYPNWKLKKRLLSSGYMPKCCSNCGYDEERIVDGKLPLLMDYVDGNKRNHKWDNLRLLCYNCWFQINGDLFGRAMRNIKKDVWDFQYIHK